MPSKRFGSSMGKESTTKSVFLAFVFAIIAEIIVLAEAKAKLPNRAVIQNIAGLRITILSLNRVSNKIDKSVIPKDIKML